MRHDHRTFPAPCSSWPADQLQAVGEAFRDAGGAGAEEEERFALAVRAYLHAGGDPSRPERTVQGMLASLSKERGDWLWAPTEAWADAHRPPPDEGLPFGRRA